MAIEKSLTKGQVEDQISKEVTKFFVKYLGHGPKKIKTFILDEMVVIRIIDDLRAFEKALLINNDSKDIEAIKDIYRRTRERYIKELLEIIEVNTKKDVVCSHHDLSTRTGERIEVFILDSEL